MSDDDKGKKEGGSGAGAIIAIAFVLAAGGLLFFIK